jgi:bacterioferritin-associated ferredoxin
MKKILFIISIFFVCSCESNRDRCIRKLVNQGNSYSDACDACDEAALDSFRK